MRSGVEPATRIGDTGDSMADLQNTFSWSHSRHAIFEMCPRAYFLNHYGFWGGWDAQAAPAVREIYIQKQLTRRPMWVGTVVHGVAEMALQSLMARRPRDPEPTIRQALARARREIEDSRRGAWRYDPKRNPGFQEHYYGEDDDASAWNETLVEIEAQLRRLFQHPVYQRMCEVPDRIVEVERLESILVGDVPVWVKLDALVSDGRGGLVVVDWKTGKSHEDEVIAAQLGVYGLYCIQQHRGSPDRIVAMHVNLHSGERRTHPVDRATLDQSRQEIVASATRMRSRLRSVPDNVAIEADFPMLDAGGRPCATCRYRRTCKREGSRPTA